MEQIDHKTDPYSIVREFDRESISLKELYQKFQKKDIDYKVYVVRENQYPENEEFELVGILGSGRSCYVFLALVDKKLVSLRMSYEESDFTDKFDSVRVEMEGDYDEHFLKLLYPSIPVGNICVGSVKKKKKLFFDKKVFASFWEKADATLTSRLGSPIEQKLQWFREFLNQVPSERVVCFVPEGGRPEFIPEGSGERLVFGGTTFMAWQGDLEGGGGRPEGVNFFMPGLGIPLVGEEKACRGVEKLLKKAGFRVTVGKPDSHMQAAVTAVMTAFVGGLELAEWSLKKFRRSQWLRRAAEAAREAVLGQLPKASAFTRTVLGIPVLTTGFHLATFFLPLLFPFDLEKYLKFHYLKTRDQTLALLELFARDGMKRELPVETIQELLQGLRDNG